jgi:hypothetical protein
MTAANPFAPIADNGRFDYTPITQRPDYCWPNGARLAVYLGFNVEHFAFGGGLGANIGPASPQPDVLNYAWREYGNRVGAWRCLELFGQSDLHEADERALLLGCRERMLQQSGTAPAGWLSPWISETSVTPDLLAETGYSYTLNWCHDDQPTRMRTRSGQTLWSIPYPQEVNDIPMVMGRLMDGKTFGELITDHFDEMRQQAAQQPLVMGIALHPYIVGQPHRLLHLRRALNHMVRARDAGDVWFTTPGQICQHMQTMTA